MTMTPDASRHPAPSSRLTGRAPRAEIYATNCCYRSRPLLTLIVVVAAVSGCSPPPPEEPEPPTKPNFIIVFADDQGYGDLGVFGATDFSTPRIDQMAREGMKFTDFYAQVVCGPSRTALLTGSYPIRVGEYGNEKNSFPYVHEQEILLPAVLQQAGYATGMIGKVDITQRRRGFKPELNPVRRGFDYWFGVVGANDSGKVDWVHRNEQMVEEYAGVDDLTRRYTDEALAFIRRNEGRPFFLYIAHTMAHVVLGVTEPFKGRSERGLYGDVIEELDSSTGEIIDLLRELGLDQNTIVVYTSDNGPWSNHSLPQYVSTITEHAGSSGRLHLASDEGVITILYLYFWRESAINLGWLMNAHIPQTILVTS